MIRWILGGLILTSTLVEAEVKLAPIFQDHMVLQRDQFVPVWGTAEPGESITVSFQAQSHETQADAAGDWQVRLSPMSAKSNGGDCVVKGSHTAVRLTDVLVGDVWLASGQSNMEWNLESTVGGKAEVEFADHSRIRLFQVPHSPVSASTRKLAGTWRVCSPDAVRRFSAVAYYFGRSLEQELDVPIGIIMSAMGGTPAESWTPVASLEENPLYAELLTHRQVNLSEYPASPEVVAAGIEKAWKARVETLLSSGAEPVPGWFEDAAVDADWKEIVFPGMVDSQLELNTDGSFWVRVAFDVPEHLDGQAAVLNLGVIDDFDFTWLNGTLVGTMGAESASPWSTPRVYQIPDGLLQAGRNVIVTRLIDHYRQGGFSSSPDELFVEFATGEKLSLAGRAIAKMETDIGLKPALPGQRMGDCAGTLYDGMIAPIAPFALSGVIWYQGESNVGRATQYRSLFPLMIQSWREAWGQELPFYFVQLSGFGKVESVPREFGWAELREAQEAALDLPATGMVTTVDLGEAQDIHPRNKREVGRRLSKVALAGTYGQQVAASGPRYESMQVVDGEVHLQFSEVHGGLVALPIANTYLLSTEPLETAAFVRRAPAGELEGFAVCGENLQWVWATARIDGDTVVVGAEEVPYPVAVRYNWSDMPLGNLANRTGLPAAPFRTDGGKR